MLNKMVKYGVKRKQRRRKGRTQPWADLRGHDRRSTNKGYIIHLHVSFHRNIFIHKHFLGLEL